MRIPAAIALGLQLILPQAVLGPRFAEAQEPAPPAISERLVDFRDGSVLRVELPADYLFKFRQTNSADNRRLDSTDVRLDSANSFRFSRLPALEQLRTIQDAVTELRAESFRHRERALKILVQGGNGFRPFLEDLFNTVADPEIHWRLAAALSLLPPHSGLYEHAYDEIITDGSGTKKGDIDEWQITANYRGTRIDLNRKNVRSIRDGAAVGTRGETPVIATTAPIRKDLEALFPQGSIRIDFEKDPNGNPLVPGQDISRRFILAGVLLETSVEGAIVSVNDYPVSGRSGGQSAATHEPLYEGIITITFCVPGDEHELAGVTHVGLYAAVVMPEGTTLAAFDASGHRIASVTTESGPHEFLGLRSNVPIHQVKIIPNVDIDPNYTFDDLIFDVPLPLDAGRNAEHYSLELASGERLVCVDFQIADDTLKARPAAMFSGEISLPLRDLVQLHTPTGRQADPVPVDGVPFWLMLDDGSTLRASASEDQPSPRAIQGIGLLDLPVTAVWSDAKDLIALPEGATLKENQVAAINTSEPMLLSDPKFTAAKFTAIREDATIQYSYNRLPSIWLKNPDDETRKKATGFIRLNTGERLVLGKETTFRLQDYSAQAVTLTRDDKEFQIPLSSITTLRLPR